MDKGNNIRKQIFIKILAFFIFKNKIKISLIYFYIIYKILYKRLISLLLKV